MHGLDRGRDAVKHRVEVQKLVLAVTAPQTGCDIQPSGAVTQSAQAPIGGVAQTKVAIAAIHTVSAGQVLFEHHIVAFLHAPLERGQTPQLLHMAHRLMTQHQRASAGGQVLVIRPVAATHPGDTDSQQARII